MKLNDLDLNKLHVFRVVAESASMREAGERLLRTPSAISQSVTSLEKALGIRLFHRSGIRLELTDPGKRILREVKETERRLGAALEELRSAPAQLRGRVTLGLPLGYPAASLADQLGAALREYPELQLRLRFQPHPELAESLRQGKSEIALSLQPLSNWNRRIQCAKLREENLILAIPSRFRHLASGASDEIPVVDYYQKPLLVEGWLRHHRLRKVRPRIRVYASNLDHVLQLLLQGVGCAVVPRHIVREELATGSLQEHSLDRKRPWMESVWLNSLKKPAELGPSERAIWDVLTR